MLVTSGVVFAVAPFLRNAEKRGKKACRISEVGAVMLGEDDLD
jgi:hypothetical protein